MIILEKIERLLINICKIYNRKVGIIEMYLFVWYKILIGNREYMI